MLYKCFCVCWDAINTLYHENINQLFIYSSLHVMLIDPHSVGRPTASRHHFVSLKSDYIFYPWVHNEFHCWSSVVDGGATFSQQWAPKRSSFFFNIWQLLLNLTLTSTRLHSVQVENCESNSRLVVDEDCYTDKFRLERVFNHLKIACCYEPKKNNLKLRHKELNGGFSSFVFCFWSGN